MCVMDIKLILLPNVDEQEHLLFGSSGRPVLFEVLTRSIAEASGVIFLQKELNHRSGLNRFIPNHSHQFILPLYPSNKMLFTVP